MMVLVKVLFWVSTSLLILSSVDAQRNGDLRLARGSFSSSSYTSGRLEIFINGQWGTVCDDSFSSNDARVACRQLGYSSSTISYVTASSISSFGSGFGTIWLDDVGCTGSESCLLSCSNRGIGSHNCVHSEDVAVFCYGSRFSSTDCSFSRPTQCTSSQFRCDNGQCVSSSYRCNGNTGGCTDGSDERGCSSCQAGAFRCSNGQCIRSSDRCDGTRECTDGSDETGCSCTSSQFRCTTSGRCISSSSRCNGIRTCTDGSDEMNCISCSSGAFRCSNRQCIRSSDRCDGTRDCADGSDETGCTRITVLATDGNLRLARGSFSSSSYTSGRLEIFINGRWGTVCDDSFSITDANVACRQLGYSGASSNPVTASSRSLFGSGSGEIWLDDVGCLGGETCLLSCYNRGIGVEDCTHSEDVAIYCSTSGTRSSSSVCSSTDTNTGATIGGALGGVLVILFLISIICAIPSGICYVKKSSKRRIQRSIAPTTTGTTVTLAASYPTSTAFTTTTSSPAQPGTSYPTTGVSPYPSQPPPQPEAYPTKPTAYPAKGQDLPPPPYPGQAFEMQPIFKPAAGSYPPQPQAAYPPAAYPPAAYPPAAYPEQTAPYSTLAPKPLPPTPTNLPPLPPTQETSIDPNQPAPSPNDLNQGNTSHE